MSLQHGQHGQHGQGAVGPDASSAEGMMAAALMRTRDAIVGTETIAPQAGQDATLEAADRLRRMEPPFRRAVLMSELLEDISFGIEEYPQKRAAARAVTVLRRGGTAAADPLPLARIIRPEVADFGHAAPLVAAYAELRADRLAEILVQKERLIPFVSAILPVTPFRAPAVVEMLETGLDIVTPVVMRAKIALGCPRPSQFSPLVQPMIAEPGHPTLPSGHATQMFTLAAMLSRLTDPGAAIAADSQLYRLACRIAINRTVAGVHFPADSAAGAVLGIQLGRYLMARGQGGTVGSASFDGTAFRDGNQPRDFHYGVLDRMVKGGDPSAGFPDDAAAVRPAPLWQSLCQRAAQEWQTRWS